MSLDQKALFDVISCAQRNGVLEKMMVLLGRAVEEALEEGNLSTGELLNMVEEVKEESLTKADAFLGMIGGFLPLANNDKLMMFSSNLLEDESCRAGIVQKVKGAILNSPSVRPPASSE